MIFFESGSWAILVRRHCAVNIPKSETGWSQSTETKTETKGRAFSERPAHVLRKVPNQRQGMSVLNLFCSLLDFFLLKIWANSTISRTMNYIYLFLAVQPTIEWQQLPTLRISPIPDSLSIFDITSEIPKVGSCSFNTFKYVSALIKVWMLP